MPNIGCGNTGALSELTACAHLLRKGYNVFRSESPHSPFDLVAYDGTRCIRVEVKTVSITAHASLCYGRPRNDEWDLLIVVGLDGHCFEFNPDDAFSDNTDLIRAHYGYPPRYQPKTACSLELCSQAHFAKGYCQKHYYQARNSQPFTYPDPSTASGAA